MDSINFKVDILIASQKKLVFFIQFFTFFSYSHSVDFLFKKNSPVFFADAVETDFIKALRIPFKKL